MASRLSDLDNCRREFFGLQSVFRSSLYAPPRGLGRPNAQQSGDMAKQYAAAREM
jgi:hypothetical protein